MLLIHISDSAATSQDGSFLEFVAANVGSAIFRMQGAEGCVI